MSLQNASTVLITGINGFIGSHIGLQILEKGYRVRAAVRNKAKLATLLEGVYKPYAQQVEVVEVSDITRDDAYDQAVIGVQHIIHVASPIDMSLPTPEQFIGPAVAGATNILNSAAKQPGGTLQTVVFTSSVIAIISPDAPKDHVFTERDWNNWAEDEVAQKGKDAQIFAWYAASKTASEKAVWKWVGESKPTFAVTAINPGFVYGPLIALPSSPAGLNTTMQPMWGYLSGETKELGPPLGSASFVDVRDVARLHVWAMEHPTVANRERYITISGQSMPQAVVDILHKGYPGRRGKMLVGEPGKGYNSDYTFVEGGQSGDKAAKATGQGWIGLEKTVLDGAKSLEPWLKN